jgi:phosphoribosylformylglycinamidine synthase subunit PurS
MTTRKAKVIVRLKEAVHDPQGETISGVLKQLDYRAVSAVRQGKFFELTLDASSKDEALELAREIAQRVLSNPVLEVFEVEVPD